MGLEPIEEVVGSDVRYNWELPLPAYDSRRSRRIRSVWYLALPLTSAHRGGHSGGGAPVQDGGEQDRYANEGTVYPHAGLLEDRKSTRLNSSHPSISYAVFCLKKKTDRSPV